MEDFFEVAMSYPMTSLYVGNLHPNVVEEDLYEMFLRVGPLESVVLCRNMITQESLRYAYVNFQEESDAEVALNTLNFDILQGLPIRIMWSQRDPSLRRSGVANVFIKNLNKNIDGKSLCDTFSAFGNILSCKVEMNEDNVSKGYGFVQYDSEESAKMAIEQINGTQLNGQKVFVGPFIPRHKRVQNINQEDNFTTVYVKNFGKETSEQQLREIFEKIGTVTSVKIQMNNDGESLGFGFVSFDNTESVKKAIEELHNKEVFDEKPLYVSRVQTKAERKENHQIINRSKNCNLFIQNLDYNVDDERLKEEFQGFGSITSAKVMLNKNGRSRGYGFVCFSSLEEATLAVENMNNRVVWRKTLSVSFAQRKDRRSQDKQPQHLQNQASPSVAQQDCNAPQDSDVNELATAALCPIQPSQSAENTETPKSLTAATGISKSKKKNIRKKNQQQRRTTLSEFIVPQNKSNSKTR